MKKPLYLLHNPHPGETHKEPLSGLGITQYRLSKDTELKQPREAHALRKTAPSRV